MCYSIRNPDTIHNHGMPITLNQLATPLPIHPNKVPSLHRLMRLLVSSDFFSIITLTSGEQGFTLTLSSQLLLKDHPLTQAPFVVGILQPEVTHSPHHLSEWFQNDVESPYLCAYGRNFWEHAGYDQEFNNYFNKAMESDSRFVTKLLVNKFKGLFEGINSLVDVGGGNGSTIKAISEAYPWLKCTVLDLPQVIQGLQDDTSNINYVAADMFQSIPNANAVLLKWILHDWSDDDCVKILKRCKEAIPRKEEGGKVIIIDIVLETATQKSKSYRPQLLFDMQMMSILGQGKERTKQEWEKLFIKAGFRDHKFHSISGVRSVIEVYPLKVGVCKNTTLDQKAERIGSDRIC